MVVDNEDKKGKPAKGKQADISPLQNCLISIVSKTRLAGDDAEIEADDRYDRSQLCCPPCASPPICSSLSVPMIHKLAATLMKQSMNNENANEFEE